MSALRIFVTTGSESAAHLPVEVLTAADGVEPRSGTLDDGGALTLENMTPGRYLVRCRLPNGVLLSQTVAVTPEEDAEARLSGDSYSKFETRAWARVLQPARRTRIPVHLKGPLATPMPKPRLELGGAFRSGEVYYGARPMGHFKESVPKMADEDKATLEGLESVGHGDGGPPSDERVEVSLHGLEREGVADEGPAVRLPPDWRLWEEATPPAGDGAPAWVSGAIRQDEHGASLNTSVSFGDGTVDDEVDLFLTHSSQVRRLEAMDAGETALGEGKRRLSSFFLVPPGVEQVMLVPDQADEAAPRPMDAPWSLAVQFHNRQARAIFSYLTLGDFEQARQSGGGFLEEAIQMLRQKMADYSSAVVAGYWLLKTQPWNDPDTPVYQALTVQRLMDWLHNLDVLSSHTADGAVIHGTALLRLGRADEARERLLAAAARGLPVFTMGVRMLVDGLKLLRTLSDEPGGREAEALAWLSPWTSSVDWQVGITTVRGVVEDKAAEAGLVPEHRLVPLATLYARAAAGAGNAARVAREVKIAGAQTPSSLRMVVGEGLSQGGGDTPTVVLEDQVKMEEITAVPLTEPFGGSVFRTPKARPPESTGDLTRPVRLRIENLPPGTSPSDVENLIAEYGEVKKVELPKDDKTGRALGFAIATMATLQALEAAVKGLDGLKILGYTLRVMQEQPGLFRALMKLAKWLKPEESNRKDDDDQSSQGGGFAAAGG